MKRIIFSVLFFLSLCSSSFGAFFTVGQEDGRWWLFDQTGEKFFSMGVCVVDPGAFYAPSLGYSPYYEKIMDLFGTEEAWAANVQSRLEEWNFNSLGAWSDAALFPDMPYAPVLYLSGADWLSGTVPDYYAQTFYDYVDAQIASAVTPRVDDENLIGYFIDNEMRWGPDWRVAQDLFADYFSFAAEAPGKIVLVDFLRDRYGDDVSAFNTAWGMSVASFDDLLPMTQIEPASFAEPKKTDREDFAGLVAEHFFSYCHDAILAADPNHLILGSRFVSWIAPRAVVEAAAPYTDVMSANHYPLWPFFEGVVGWLEDTLGWMHTDDILQEYYDISQKPILITEFAIRGMDSGLPNTYPYNWFFKTVQTQVGRADYFEDIARASFASGYIIGYHWFSYMDEPAEGRFDGENSNFGLVDNNDDPWLDLTERMKTVNADAYIWPITDDDSADDTSDDTADDTSDDTSDDTDDDSADDVTDDSDDDSDDDSGDDADDISDDDGGSSSGGGDDDDGGCCG